MPLPASGTLTLDMLAAEFGGAAPHSLNEYYRSGGLVPNTALNAGVPTSGAIALSNFYGAGAATANIVVPSTWNVSINALGSPTGGGAGRLSLSNFGGNAGRSYKGTSTGEQFVEIEPWGSPIAAAHAGIQIRLTVTSGALSTSHSFNGTWLTMGSTLYYVQNTPGSMIGVSTASGILEFRNAASLVVLGTSNFTLTHTP
jgi:hypothetical protein